MRVPSTLTNAQIENLFKEIDDEIIYLPQKFKSLRIGLLPRICQLFITSLKRDPYKKVKFPQLDISAPNSALDVLECPNCLTAILMSDKVFGKDISSNGSRNQQEIKSRINSDIQNRLNESIFRKGHRVQMFAVDHSIKKYAFPLCFYSPEGSNTLRQSAFYTKLLNRILELAPPNSMINEEEINDLGQMIFELIENTEQHGKHEFDTGKSKKSVRGLVIDYKLINRDQSSVSIGGDDSPITDYLESIRANNRTVHLLEISVFDSGAGIAKTLEDGSVDFLNVADEVNVVKKSFVKGITSKADSEGYGRGLFNVRNILAGKYGYISIRTGKVGLYRDFKTQPLTENEGSSLSLYDEEKRSNSEFSELAPAEGLAYSILVPLR